MEMETGGGVSCTAIRLLGPRSDTTWAVDFLRVQLIFGFVYANSVGRQTEEGLPGSGGNSNLTGNPQPRVRCEEQDN